MAAPGLVRFAARGIAEFGAGRFAGFLEDETGAIRFGRDKIGSTRKFDGLDEAEEQLKSIKAAQKKFREAGQPHRIEATRKSEDRFRNELKNLANNWNAGVRGKR